MSTDPSRPGSGLIIARDALLNLLNSLSALVAGMGGSILLSRYLGPQGYGEYETAIWIVGTGSILLGLGMAETVRRYVAELNGKGQPDAAFRLVAAILVCQTAAALPAVLALAVRPWWLANLLRQPQLAEYVALSAAAVAPEVLSSILQNALMGLRRFKWLTGVGVLKSALTFAAVAVGVSFDLGIAGLLRLLIAVYVATMAVYGLLVLRLWLRFRVSRSSGIVALGPPVRFAAAIFFTLLMDAMVWQRSGIFFLSLMSTPAEIAFYNLGSSVGYVALSTVPLSLAGVLTPALAERWGAADHDGVKRIHSTGVQVSAAICLPLALGGIAVAQPFVQAVYGPQFERAAPVLALALISTTMAVLASNASSALQAVRRADVLAKVAAAAAVLNVVLCMALVPARGAAGAAFSNMIVRTVSALILLGTTGRLLGLRYEMKLVSRAAFAAGACALLAAVVARSGPPPLLLPLSVVAAGLLYVLLLLVTGWSRAVGAHDLVAEALSLTRQSLGIGRAGAGAGCAVHTSGEAADLSDAGQE